MLVNACNEYVSVYIMNYFWLLANPTAMIKTKAKPMVANP